MQYTGKDEANVRFLPARKKKTDSIGIDHEKWADIGLVL